MTNEEAKQLYVQALEQVEKQAFAQALDLLDTLDRERPNSRQVTYHRVRCLAALGRLGEAQESLAKLEGKMEKERVEELQEAIETARAIKTATPAVPAEPETGPESNVFIIESAFMASTNETTVTGHMQSGVFHVGDNLTIVSPDGMPFIAPILRIGSAETPLNLVRAGQKTVLLLKVEPHLVTPGSKATAEAQAEYYAATMVVSTEAKSTSRETVTSDIVEAEKLIKQGKFEEARASLEKHLAQDPDNRGGHWLLARAYLEAAPPAQEVKKSLEHIRRAYELGGAEDPAVIDTLAHALAANGEPEQGLRFLERLHAGNLPMEARMALAQRIVEYRNRYGMGHLWEFADNYGDVLFEAKSAEETLKALKNGSLPRESKCRKDRLGEWRDIRSAFSAESPEIVAFYQPAAKGFNPLYIVIIAVLAAAIAAALFLL